MTVLDLVQETLDTLLFADGVRVYWQRRKDITDAEASQKEYVIYSQEGDAAETAADGDVMTRTAAISVLYYINADICRTKAGRTASQNRMKSISAAMKAAEFFCPGGWMELGDIDDAGFSTFQAEFDMIHFEED